MIFFKLEAQNRCLSSTSVSSVKVGLNLIKFPRWFVTVGYISNGYKALVRRPTGDCSGDKPAADMGNASSFQRQYRTSATSPVTALALRRADSHARYHFTRLRSTSRVDFDLVPDFPRLLRALQLVRKSL